ncbi:MAG: type III restriction-modification system endonuclease [Prevotellaceae bacterium]|nr:type III restriction-modification system endonuclease [Prevotellaceae bacterium]
MELILQSSLPHQQRAVDAIADVFKDTWIKSPVNYYSNPEITIFRDGVGNNIRRVQEINKIPKENGGYTHETTCLNLDIKMETGTGKTYVYVHTMYELHKRYGINKFIIAVPTLPIKAGARQFMEDEYVKRHFRDACGYDAEIDLLTLEPPKKKKKGRQYFPAAVSYFVKGSCQDAKKIYVLLVNMQLLKDAKNYILSRSDYGSVVEGFYRPYNALKATRPFVIIDEPHKFSRDQKAFGIIQTEIAPQCIIRFGATFPEITIGKGKNKKIIKDYQNLLYNLNACQSFNQGLIKGVAKEHFEPSSQRNEKIKLLSVTKNDSATLQHKQEGVSTKVFQLCVGDSLSQISDELAGLTILSIDKNAIELSNGQIKTVGEEMNVDVFMSSYQEQMIKLALERHFETERRNFCGRTFKIKTLALFFIDDITSYRKSEDGKKPYILEAFERLLEEKLKETISRLTAQESQYREYLEASLKNIGACHAGYFAQDNSSSDESIAEEVNDILNGKKQLLSFKDKNGNLMLRRFLFSKWTLKEGWDNPNVFTIAKLRSSGSDISKLQEVGRGLRLPVDECGNRISNEEFTLNYIVDFTEANFAKKLVEQINSEIPTAVALSFPIIQQTAQKMETDANQLLIELLTKKYIDGNFNIVPENRSMFFEEYPLFQSGLKNGIVNDRNSKPNHPVKIRKARFEELRELWEKLNQRYTIWYDSDLNKEIDKALDDFFATGNIFTENVISSRRDTIISDGEHVSSTSNSGVQYIVNQALPYGVFLKRVSSATNISLEKIHGAICRYASSDGNLKDSYFNEQAISAIIQAFTDWKIKNLQGRFKYKKTSGTAGATALTYEDGSVREEIAQGRIGIKIKEGDAADKYLYDTKAYDSPLELDNIESDINGGLSGVAEVIVYGKIPRNSIAIPIIAGGTYSPDFMYIVQRTNGKKELNIVVETKDVEHQSTLRGIEEAKIRCAEIFFKNLSEQGYNVHFRTQLNNKKMLQIVEEVINE